MCATNIRMHVLRSNTVFKDLRIVLPMKCTIAKAIHEKNEKKYIKIKVDDPSKFYKPPQSHVQTFVNPLKGDSLSVKVPFRYNRVMCKMFGGKTIHELVEGDVVDIDISFCGYWMVGGFGGPSWKVDSIST